MTSKSQNGYPANDISRTKVWSIPGTSRDVRLEKGDAGFLLVDIAAWFDKNVESIDSGQLDDWGYAERTIRGSSTELSNHASGTAIDLNATRHPLGKSGTFSAKQAAAIRDRLRVYEGCIRWGGDYRTRKDEMHFEIVGSPADVARVATQLRAPAAPPKPEKATSQTPAIDAAITNARASIISAQAALEGRSAGPVLAHLQAGINQASGALGEFQAAQALLRGQK